MLLIDWIAAEIPCRHADALLGDRVVCVSPDGEMRWETHKRLQVEGSHSAVVTVKSSPKRAGGTADRSHLWVSGNPTKWLQGHALFGVDDVHGLIVSMLLDLLPRLGITPSALDRYQWDEGCIRLTRVDLTAMYSAGSRANARAWIRAASTQAVMSHRGRGILTGDTLYFGKHSRRSALKIYSKGDEITARGHEIPLSVSHHDDLVAYAEDKLRFELVLRSMELQRLGLSYSLEWGVTLKPWDLFRSYLEKLSLAEKFRLPAEVMDDLPGRLRTAYLAWRAGEDLRATLSRATFYRYRSELLPHGVDIAVVNGPDRTNVVPLVKVIEAVPAGVPRWAIGTPLYFQPPRRQVG